MLYEVYLYEHLLLCMAFKGRYRVMGAQYIRRYVELCPEESNYNTPEIRFSIFVPQSPTKHIFPNSLFK
jgi:predicted anti-sigma-YlaC factor YlaD